MFTNFHGFHLVEDYHKWKKEHRIRKNPIGLKSLKLLIAICIPIFLWIAPSEVYGLPGLNPVEHRVLAIFVFAALMWLFDAVPAWTTSLVVVVLLLFCNAIALKFLNDPNGMNMSIGFGQWMMVMVPLTLVLLFISWFVLKKLFPFKQKQTTLKIESDHVHTCHSRKFDV